MSFGSDSRNESPPELVDQALASRLSRRALLRKSAILGLSISAMTGLLAACGEDDDADSADEDETDSEDGEDSDDVDAAEGDDETEPEESDDSDEAAASDEGAENLKESLIIGFPTDVTNLDIHRTTGLHIHGFAAQIADVLVRLDENSEPFPWLVEEWEWQDDGNSLVLTIRDGVQMHDGNTLTAEDVRYSIVRFREYSVGASELRMVTEVEALDDRNVRLSMDNPYPLLVPTLSYTPLGIYSKEAIEEVGDDDFERHPVGPGPYKYLERQEGEYVRLEAFEDYWAGAPQTRYVEVRALPEMGSRVQVLEAGDVDLIFNVSPQDAQRLDEDDQFKVLDLPAARLIRIVFNNQNEPVNDRLVRQAIAYGIDRQAIVDTIFLGTATVSHSPGPDYGVGYTGEYDVYDYDPDRAQELLNEAGLSDGLSFELVLAPGRYLLTEDVAQLMRSQLLEANIDMEIVPMEWGALSDFIRVPPEENEMHAAILGWRSANGDVHSAISDMHSNRWPPEGNNTAYYSNPEFDELSDQAEAEDDPDQREMLLEEMQRVLMEDLPFIPLYHNPHLWAAKAGVEGVEVNALTSLQPLHEAVVRTE